MGILDKIIVEKITSRTHVRKNESSASSVFHQN